MYPFVFGPVKGWQSTFCFVGLLVLMEEANILRDKEYCAIEVCLLLYKGYIFPHTYSPPPASQPSNQSYEEHASITGSNEEQPMPYAVLINEGQGTQDYQKHTFPGHWLALRSLMRTRKRLYDSFVVPTDVADREAFPYRNKIGSLRDDSSNHWGYRFRTPNGFHVVSVWIEKDTSGPSGSARSNRTLKEVFESENGRKLGSRTDIKYDTFPGVDLAPPEGRFSKKMADFVFPEQEEEEEEDEEEDEEAEDEYEEEYEEDDEEVAKNEEEEKKKQAVAVNEADKNASQDNGKAGDAVSGEEDKKVVQ